MFNSVSLDPHSIIGPEKLKVAVSKERLAGRQGQIQWLSALLPLLLMNIWIHEPFFLFYIPHRLKIILAN
jgi:hypothetical protein